jgi:hypothetical protein
MVNAMMVEQCMIEWFVCLFVWWSRNESCGCRWMDGWSECDSFISLWTPPDVGVLRAGVFVGSQHSPVGSMHGSVRLLFSPVS